MNDYVHYICPQFSRTHINFQRVPVVDTSNPFIARHIPSADESMLVIRFADPRGIDFPYLLSMLHDSFMSRSNTIVCPGGKMDLAMQLDLHADDLASDGAPAPGAQRLTTPRPSRGRAAPAEVTAAPTLIAGHPTSCECTSNGCDETSDEALAHGKGWVALVGNGRPGLAEPGCQPVRPSGRIAMACAADGGGTGAASAARHRRVHPFVAGAGAAVGTALHRRGAGFAGSRLHAGAARQASDTARNGARYRRACSGSWTCIRRWRRAIRRAPP